MPKKAGTKAKLATALRWAPLIVSATVAEIAGLIVASRALGARSVVLVSTRPSGTTFIASIGLALAVFALWLSRVWRPAQSARGAARIWLLIVLGSALYSLVIDPTQTTAATASSLGIILTGFALCLLDFQIDASASDANQANPEKRSRQSMNIHVGAEELIDNTDLGRELNGLRLTVEDLRCRQAEMEDLFENAAVGMQLVGTDGKILRANGAGRGLLGYTSEEYVAHNITEFLVEGTAATDWLQRLAQGETLANRETRLRAKDGSIKHLQIDVSSFWRDGQCIHTRWFFRDITDRKRLDAESAELLINETVARARAEDSTEMVRRLQAIVDFSSMSLPLDDLLREMLGRIRDLLSADATAVFLLAEDRRGLVARSVVGPREDVREELTDPKGQGIGVHIATTRTPILLNDLSAVEVVGAGLYQRIRSLIGAPLAIEGEVIGVIYAVAIEPSRFGEEDLRLLQLVADRVAFAIEHARLYEAEQRARRAAEAANRMKDEFLATVSHELRSPLNAILGWLKLLRAGKLDAEAAAHALATVERSARTQNRIINDLLDVSRIITGKLRLNVRPIEPCHIIEAAVEAVRPAADAKSISLELVLDQEAGPISADPDRLQQIVWNLLSNAIKFTPGGGRVEVVLRRADARAEIEVRDSGIGISSNFLPYVFDRFRQADASSTRGQRGLGLGLAIVRHLVELHGGTVDVESAGPDKGTTFTVNLPRALGLNSWLDARSTRKSRDDIPLYGTAELSGVRILVVDDDPDARELMVVILSQTSAEIRAVASAAEAVKIISTRADWAPDVLISDIEMPETDGYALIREVRALEAEHGGRVPAVAVTAYSRAEDRRRAFAAGFQLHIAKPIEPGELLAGLASLTRKQSRGKCYGAQ